jgi:hypothetical protein
MVTTTHLTEEEAERIRAAVATAVSAGREDLVEALETDPESYLVLLDAARIGATETTRLLREAVASARSAGHSWEAIGGVLGISRQAAQQRFGATVEPETTGDQKVLFPLTAFTEMEALERAGREGWHLVSFGTLRHVVEASDQQWEHRRVPLSLGARHRRLEEDGWQGIGAWFPWRYYKRPLGLPPEPAGNTDKPIVAP